MKKYIASFICILAGYSASAVDLAPDVPPSKSLQNAAEVETFSDAAMRTLMDGYKVPAAALVIVKDGRVLLAKGYGYADIERRTRIDPQTSLFRIGSISKLFTWTAVMQLVEQGKLDLDADINQYLANAPVPARFDRKITLRHLLTHTAGFEERIIGYQAVAITHDESGAGASALADYLKRYSPERVRPPNETTAYSNYGAALAGLIVQNVSGEPFDAYVRRHIFVPLGMDSSTFAEPVPPRLQPQLVTGYSREAGVFVAKEFEYIGGLAPAGSASAAPLDMSRFMLAHLGAGAYQSGRILRPETVALMQRRAFGLDRRLPGMALGFYEREFNGVRAIAHAGDTSHFHSDLLLVPEQQLGLFVSFVADGGGAAREGFTRAFFDHYFPASASALASATPIASPERYVGDYLLTRRNYSGAEKALAMLGGAVTVSVRGNRLLLAGADEAPWQLEQVSVDLFRQVDGPRRVAFIGAAPQAATHLLIDNLPFMPLERVSGTASPNFWYTLLLVACLALLSVITLLLHRFDEIRSMPEPQRRAVYLAAAAVASIVALLASAAIGAAIYRVDLLVRAPFMLDVILAWPLVFTALTVLVSHSAVQAWRRQYWNPVRRLHYTAIALVYALLCAFFYEWNLLGWQLN